MLTGPPPKFHGTRDILSRISAQVIPRVYAKGELATYPEPPPALDGVGGRVFTHRIEHIFE
jgi:hypothetical protein